MAKSALIKSSLVKKYWMAFTGLFLCLFLVGHLAGNLQLLASGEGARDQFNEYALFMTTNPVVNVLSILTFASVLFHVIDGIMLTVSNRRSNRLCNGERERGQGSVYADSEDFSGCGNGTYLGICLSAFDDCHRTAPLPWLWKWISILGDQPSPV